MFLQSHTAKGAPHAMIECNITASTPLLVAIDISKGRHEVLIEVPDKKRCRRVSVLNTLDEFERLIKLLRSFQRPVRVAFEATGNYHRALAFQLGAAGFNIKLFPLPHFIAALELEQTYPSGNRRRRRDGVSSGVLYLL